MRMSYEVGGILACLNYKGCYLLRLAAVRVWLCRGNSAAATVPRWLYRVAAAASREKKARRPGLPSLLSRSQIKKRSSLKESIIVCTLISVNDYLFTNNNCVKIMNQKHTESFTLIPNKYLHYSKMYLELSIVHKHLLEVETYLKNAASLMD